MKMMIDGQKTGSGDGKTIPVINPITNEVIDTIPMATKEDVDRALEASKRGLKKWSAVPLKEKEVIFERFFRLMEENKREIIGTLMRESGSSVRNGLFQWQGYLACSGDTWRRQSAVTGSF